MTSKEKKQEFKKSRRLLINSMKMDPESHIHYRFRTNDKIWIIVSIFNIVKYIQPTIFPPTWYLIIYILFSLLVIACFITDTRHYLISTENYLGVVGPRRVYRVGWNQINKLRKHESNFGTVLDYAILDIGWRDPDGQFYQLRSLNCSKVSKITSKWFEKTGGEAADLSTENLTLRKYIYDLSHGYMEHCDGRDGDCAGLVGPGKGICFSNCPYYHSNKDDSYSCELNMIIHNYESKFGFKENNKKTG